MSSEFQTPPAINLGADAAAQVSERLAAVDARLDALSPADRVAVAERQRAEGLAALQRISARPPRKAVVAHVALT